MEADILDIGFPATTVCVLTDLVPRLLYICVDLFRQLDGISSSGVADVLGLRAGSSICTVRSGSSICSASGSSDTLSDSFFFLCL